MTRQSKRIYLSAIFQNPSPLEGTYCEETIEHSIELIHDLHVLATRPLANLHILHDTILTERFEEVFKSFTHRPYNHMVDDILAQGGCIEYLLWTTLDSPSLSPHIQRIMAQRKELIDSDYLNSRVKGHLGIRKSGITTQKADVPLQILFDAPGFPRISYIEVRERPYTLDPLTSRLNHCMFVESEKNSSHWENFFRKFKTLYEAIKE